LCVKNILTVAGGFSSVRGFRERRGARDVAGADMKNTLCEIGPSGYDKWDQQWYVYVVLPE